MQTSIFCFDRLSDRAIGDAGRVGVRLAGDDLRAEPIAPNRELLDGGGAERVAGAEDDALALRLEELGELGDRGRFAGAVDAADHDHGRAGGGELDRAASVAGCFTSGVGGHQGFELCLPGFEDLVERDDAAAEVGGDLFDDLLDGVEAHVGLEEDRAHFVEERLVDEAALGLEEVADVGLEELAGLGEALF